MTGKKTALKNTSECFKVVKLQELKFFSLLLPYNKKKTNKEKKLTKAVEMPAQESFQNRKKSKLLLFF